MNTRLAAFVGLLALTTSPALADDSELLRKSISSAAGQTTDPVSEAEHAFVDMMKFYVPAQRSNGAVGPIDYVDADGGVVTRSYARPLIGVYIYGPVEGVEGVGFSGHGRRDAWAAVSLDDGNTWKRTNLSESGDLTSCDGNASGGGCSVERTDIALFAETDYAYPGDVTNVFQSTSGTRTLAVWPSRFCQGGSPSYSLVVSNSYKLFAIADHLGIDIGTDPLAPTNPSPDDLYVLDMFGVGGSQGSVDYSEDRFEENQAVGEVPYSCLWAARGNLVAGDDPRTSEVEQSYLRWFKAERLTSGRRDVNRIETVCVDGAGCAITWQEDPEGLRGGQGEGPGEGWSGAVANSQTDVWYSYIAWDDFDLVEDPTDPAGAAIITLADYELLAQQSGTTQRPQAGVPFAIPMRVTDNAKCNVDNPAPYCNGSAISADHLDVLDPLAYGMVDRCVDTVPIQTGNQGSTTELCVTEQGLPIVGNVAATRPRLGLYGYDSDADAAIDSAFVVIEAEESKGLGAFGFDAGAPCDPDASDTCIAFDEGKNLWYYSFNMALTGDAAGNYASVANADSLLANLAGHGNQLNQPEVDWRTGEFYPVANTADLWGFGAYDFEIWNTEIARRGSLLAQDISKVTDAAQPTSGLLALPSWKQGVMNQGGPADVMVRRILMPADWTPASGNPYAFRNLDCDQWAYGRDASGLPLNPHYPDGLCMDPAINLSGSIPDACTDSQDAGVVACPTVTFGATTFGVGDTNPVLQGQAVVEPNTTKVLAWHQCPATFTTISSSGGPELRDCTTDARTDASTLADQSWYNPLDVAKGHRGFLDGDFIMLLYAWSPNWRLNARGSDRYELYVRRSFDGGQTWTTLPQSYLHRDGSLHQGQGTVTCETFRNTDTGTGEPNEPHLCNTYAAGAPEQARNVTQHRSMRITTLDPRYAYTAATIVADPFGTGYAGTIEDVNDPTRFALVYETGDNTTTAEGEPEPDDLFLSRAVEFGDHYLTWAERTDLTSCYPTVAYDTMPDVDDAVVGSGFCNEFAQLDQGSPGLQSSEASLEANPGGEFIYAAWAQWEHEEIVVTEPCVETTSLVATTTTTWSWDDDDDEDDDDDDDDDYHDWWNRDDDDDDHDWWDHDDDDDDDDDDDHDWWDHDDDDDDHHWRDHDDDDDDSDDDDDDDSDDDGDPCVVDVVETQLLRSDAIVRRVWLIDGYIPSTAWTSGGGQQ